MDARSTTAVSLYYAEIKKAVKWHSYRFVKFVSF